MTEPSSPQDWLAECLRRIGAARVVVFGDFSVDAYWQIDPDRSELSLETGRPVHRAVSQRYGLGGAGNVAANLVALGVRSVAAVGLAGDDLFGQLMIRLLSDQGVNTEGVLACQTDWQTLVFAKPCIGDEEQNRIDFGSFNRIDDRTIAALAQRLLRAASRSDAVILNQQTECGVSTAGMISALNAVIEACPGCLFIADTRHRAREYRGAALKLNAHELAEYQGQTLAPEERIDAERVRALAQRSSRETGRPVFVTRGEHGLTVADGDEVQDVPGIRVLGRVDPVGAGDTVVAALGAALAVGCDPLTAARLANIAAAVTVRKLKTTGTASPAEIEAIGPAPDYVYLPELAEDLSRARYLSGTRIEIVRTLPPELEIRHAIFDHDGTISTLREGWEAVMHSFMVRAVLGAEFGSEHESLRRAVTDRVRELIEETTGVQTLRQMQYLVELIREFGCVPEGEVKDIQAYKAIYLDALRRIVDERTNDVLSGKCAAERFQIKGARTLLDALRRGGVKLYLASGTDTADAVADADALGYATAFQGRIFGATGDVRDEAKQRVLSALVRDHSLRGPEVVVFGDGPVELREARRHGAIAVGVASDERRREGLNPGKRARLIRAGADLIIPDYAEATALLGLFGLTGG